VAFPSDFLEHYENNSHGIYRPIECVLKVVSCRVLRNKSGQGKVSENPFDLFVFHVWGLVRVWDLLSDSADSARSDTRVSAQFAQAARAGPRSECPVQFVPVRNVRLAKTGVLVRLAWS
jgi:hypothetical protein